MTGDYIAGSIRASVIAQQHTDAAEQPVAIFLGYSSPAGNAMTFGGGAGTFNAATAVAFYTAEDTTTTIGTERMLITNTGEVEFNGDVEQTADGTRFYNNYASGFAGSGFQIDRGITHTGETSAEFDHLTVRGTMNIYELLIHQIRATNGSI